MADTNFSDRSGSTAGTTIVAAWLNALNKWGFWGRRPSYATTTGSANAQILTLETGSLYTSEGDGDEFTFKAGFTNGAAMTLQVIPPSGTNTARAVQMNQLALVGGEVQSGSIYKVQRLGTTWQLFNLQQLADGQPVVVNAADITKKLRFALSGLTTATTRVITWADQNLTFTALTAVGDSWWASAAGILTRLAVGSNGQITAADSTQTTGVRWIDPGFRGMLAGCQLTWVSGTSYTLGAGTCRDDADTENMKVASAITMSNLTVGWVVGNNQPKIRTGVTLANGMTLHAYVIKRVDTGVVDWFFTDEASNPTLPTSYTKSRRVASRLFASGTQTFSSMIQDGDLVEYVSFVGDVNANNPGSAAVTRTLSVPTGVNLLVNINGVVSNAAAAVTALAYFSDLATTDTAASGTNSDIPETSTAAGTSRTTGFTKTIRTNTSAQIRSRLSASDANVSLLINTLSWVDTRGRFA